MTESRPLSGYQDLSLDDDDDTSRVDPWQPKGDAKSPSSPSTHRSTSRFSTGSSVHDINFAEASSSSRPSYQTYDSSSTGVTSPTHEEEEAGKGLWTKSRFNTLAEAPLVLGVAVVDFNHLVGPTVEFAYPPSLQAALDHDEVLNRLLPFLALPDGAHLSEEDYSYFHCAYDPADSSADTEVPVNQTLFGISCNRQLAATDLIQRPSDVTRSTVQKAVIVIASQPVFGPIRDRLGIVTRAFFAQRDFTQTEILKDFYHSLETSLESNTGEGSIYIGTSLRDLIHKFRHRTLVLLKMLMLQKRIMLFGYPVEMLCTYQYSLVSLMPGLLMNLRDSGVPALDTKTTRARPTSLRSSDRSSLLRYMGLPLHLFGRQSFFQPYLPLQQVEMLTTRSWLVGTTNQIVTQQRDCKYDLLVNIENVSFDFADPKLERLVALTAADRKWMDDVVRTVEETWEQDQAATGIHFRGSDDDLRSRFEEYICAALSSIKFADFLTKGKEQDLQIIGVGGEDGILHNFGEPWLAAFKQTEAFHVWNSCTDAALFDIIEPKHPCDGQVNAVSDLGLRLAEGLHDLKLDQQLAPTREVLSSAFSAGSTAIAAGSSSLFKAFDGVRSDISSRLEAERAKRAVASPSSTASGTEATETPRSANSSWRPWGGRTSGEAAKTETIDDPTVRNDITNYTTPPPITQPSAASAQIPDIRATLGGIGSGIGSFFGSRVASLRTPPQEVSKDAKPPSGLRPMSLTPTAKR